MWRSEEVIFSSMKKRKYMGPQNSRVEAFKGCQLLILQIYIIYKFIFQNHVTSKTVHSDQHTLSDTSSLC